MQFTLVTLENQGKFTIMASEKPSKVRLTRVNCIGLKNYFLEVLEIQACRIS